MVSAPVLLSLALFRHVSAQQQAPVALPHLRQRGRALAGYLPWRVVAICPGGRGLAALSRLTRDKNCQQPGTSRQAFLSSHAPLSLACLMYTYPLHPALSASHPNSTDSHFLPPIIYTVGTTPALPFRGPALRRGDCRERRGSLGPTQKPCQPMLDPGCLSVAGAVQPPQSCTCAHDRHKPPQICTCAHDRHKPPQFAHVHMTGTSPF